MKIFVAVFLLLVGMWAVRMGTDLTLTCYMEEQGDSFLLACVNVAPNLQPPASTRNWYACTGEDYLTAYDLTCAPYTPPSVVLPTVTPHPPAAGGG